MSDETERPAHYWRSMYEDQLRRKRILHERFDRLHGVATRALTWIEDEAEGVPSWCGEDEMLRYDARRSVLADELRAAL